MNIGVTGFSGFLGASLCRVLESKKLYVIGNREPDFYHASFIKCDFNLPFEIITQLQGIEIIIHCAARAHIMNDESLDPLSEYRAVNTEGTLNLAKQAVSAGVKRFIFISSIKVNGESTILGKPFTSEDPRLPQDFYGQSKSEAEEQLLELAETTGMEVVIIRPTLVYGPGVKANFASLLNLVNKGLPLPFACIENNRRSLVSVKNLVDLIIICIDHPKAVNQIFLVSDDNDMSTAEMINKMSIALNKKSWMIPMPLWCYKFVGKLTGKQAVVDRLLGSLQVDISKTKELLDWTPPQSVEDGFKETAKAFLKNKNMDKH